MDKNNIEKHKKYYKSYNPNEIFWGIGIENETYLEIPNQPIVSGKLFYNNKRERYSLNYYDTYKKGSFTRMLNNIIDKDCDYPLPLLLNSHELTKNDLSGQPIKNYDKGATNNKYYSGKTVFDHMQETDPYFKEEYNKSFCFDGDTIEFMTKNFYKTNTQHVISELLHHKKLFLKNINKLNLPIANNEMFIFPSENHGFARFTTNKNNLAIFNNGTYHFNFTLPTELNEIGSIKDKTDFKKRHEKAINIIQAFEPLFIAKFGSGDILAKTANFTKRFPKGSQRVAASRYISAGTYNTKKMISGKLLTQERTDLEKDWPVYFWYNKLYNQINYNKNKKIGFDINYNKFKNHGIEIRFFDWFPEKHLDEVLTFLVHLLDISESFKKIDSIHYNEEWNNLMYGAIVEGKDYILTKDEICWIKKTFKLKVKTVDRNIIAVYNSIFEFLKKKYKFDGPCSKFMLDTPNICCSIFSGLNYS